jgi:RES domain-containing protein
MRGSFLHGGRYNIKEYFGVFYTSLSWNNARQEIAQYFPVPPMGGFVESTIDLRLGRVLDLTNSLLLRRARIARKDLTAPSYLATQAIGLRAWECGIEGIIAPSTVNSHERNMVVLLDNQHPLWRVGLTKLRRVTMA